MDSSSKVEAMAEARMTMVVNVVRNTTDKKASKVVMAEDSKTTALKVDAQEEETFLRVESKSFNSKVVAQKLTMILVALLITLSNTQAILVTLECSPLS